MCVCSVKLMAVGFCSIDATLGLCYSGDGCGNCLSFTQYLETGASKEYKFGTNVSNKMLLNAAKCQGYSFYRF